jgi:hypothetical protein
MLPVSLLLAAAAAALALGPVPPVGIAAVPGVGGGSGGDSLGRRASRRRSRAGVLVAVTCLTVGTVSPAVTGCQLALVVIAAGSALAVARMVATSRRAQEAAGNDSS